MKTFSLKSRITGNRWSYLPTRVEPAQSKTVKNDARDRLSHTADKGKANDIGQTVPYFNHIDIKQKAIQVLYTEEARGENLRQENIPWHKKVIHPNKPFRRIFDVMTVGWVLYLVFFIPLEIGFSWFVVSPRQKVLHNFLDVWFAVDLILNFRTGYICHGTIIMDQKRILWYETLISYSIAIHNM
jgi:hypothetical protein